MKQQACVIRLKITAYLPVLCSSGPWCSACSSSSTWQAVPLTTPGIFLFSCRHSISVQKQIKIKQTYKTYKLKYTNSVYTDTIGLLHQIKVVAKIQTCTWEGTFLGGSMRMEGSHSPGGRTVTWSRNSSIPASRSVLSFALYATSWKIWCIDKWKIKSAFTGHIFLKYYISEIWLYFGKVLPHLSW